MTPPSLSFDASDDNGDGVPDAIDFAIPGSMVSTVLAKEGSIQVALYGVNLPLPLLADGEVATVNLTVAPGAAGTAGLSLQRVSLADDLARSLTIETSDGAIQIGDRVLDVTFSDRIFLPAVVR